MSTGWMGCVCVRDSVWERLVPRKQAVCGRRQYQDEGACGRQRWCPGGGGSAQGRGGVRGASTQEEGAM